MMSLLFCLLIVLAVRSVLLPNAEIGLRYYLYPDFGTIQKIGVPECIFAACYCTYNFHKWLFLIAEIERGHYVPFI